MCAVFLVIFLPAIPSCLFTASTVQPSPTPYRRDSTIIYTDARTSFGIDADSISRDSTISSSGSDMTVILPEDMDISVEDLKQLTETSSKIGIEISPIPVETSEDCSNDLNNDLGELPPAMELSNSFRNYQKCFSDHHNTNRELAVTKVASNLRETTSSQIHIGKSNTLKRFVDAKNNECLHSESLVPSSMQASCLSIASSRGSGKSTGTENCKGKDSSKNSKKGLLSKFKSFRNSLRIKKSDSISFQKKTDGNANVLSKHRDKTKSENVISRKSYDAFRHPNSSLRDVVGVKSVSSDHLNAYRVNNKSHVDEITAKSLEMLVETCI